MFTALWSDQVKLYTACGSPEANLATAHQTCHLYLLIKSYFLLISCSCGLGHLQRCVTSRRLSLAQEG